MHHQLHACHLLGYRRVDRADSGVRIGTAQECHLQGSRLAHVIHVESVAGEQARVLESADTGSDPAAGPRLRDRNWKLGHNALLSEQTLLRFCTHFRQAVCSAD